MKLFAAAILMPLLLAACGQVEPLRRTAATPGAKAVASSSQLPSEVPVPGPEARPEVRHPFLEPQNAREDDRFDLPPTER
ncbi:MAG TPA: hypothetical protein VF727_14625 [Allosphingosinicella sp.]|jgi:hypothetical protein